jgi:hypothetical protein
MFSGKFFSTIFKTHQKKNKLFYTALLNRLYEKHFKADAKAGHHQRPACAAADNS